MVAALGIFYLPCVTTDQLPDTRRRDPPLSFVYTTAQLPEGAIRLSLFFIYGSAARRREPSWTINGPYVE